VGPTVTEHPCGGRQQPSGGARLILLCLLLGTIGCEGSTPTAERPSASGAEGLNVVFILSDTLRAPSLALYGYLRENAPFLSKLAEESLVFERHLANYPGTPVSVSQMLTGRLMPPLMMGFGFALAPVRAIEDDLLILPRALQEVGYRTGIVTSHPWFDNTARVLDYFDSIATVKPRDEYPYAQFADLAEPTFAFLDNRAADGAPFFLYIHSMDTHSPLRDHEGFDRFGAATDYPAPYDAYDGEILYTDHWVEQIYSRLQDHGLLETTIFVFTSDHGEDFNEVGPGWWNRDHGSTVRRAQVHVPLVLRLPTKQHAGRRWTGITRHIDVAPTLLTLALSGFSPDQYRLDGLDLSGHLESGPESAAIETSFAYSWRYWGLHLPDEELIYDQWKDSTSLYRIEKGNFNYPFPVEVAAGDESDLLVQTLRHEYEHRTREFLRLLPSQAKLAHSIIGIPTTVVREESAVPTFERQSHDDRWYQQVGLLLEAAPGERPGPLVLATPWSAGTYRVVVRLHAPSRARGYQNRFRINFPNAKNEPVIVDGLTADADGRIDLGLKVLGNVLQVRVSDPQGGVAITGFELTLESSEAERIEIDPEQEGRLRALGYLQ
jgi:arylsulfatase A-like enzyme